MAKEFSLGCKSTVLTAYLDFESALTSLWTFDMNLNVGSLTCQVHSCGADDQHVQERPLVGLENICRGNA